MVGEVERNKAVVRAFIDAINAQDWGRVAEFVVPEFTRHSHAGGVPGVRSRDDLLRFLRGELIVTATERAREAGLNNVRFEVADTTSYAGSGFDVIAFFDCLHDMTDPVGAARHARQALAPDGHCMIVEPFAGDRVEENLNPIGRIYYGASSLICVPVSLAKGGPALGAQAGQEKLRRVIVDEGGFSSLRRAAETPFNIILEARP